MQREERARVRDDALDLPAVAHDRGVADEPLDPARVETGNARRVESGERLPVAVALREDRAPGEARLRTLERHQLEERALVDHRDAPFAVVVVALHGASCAPGAAGHGGLAGRHRRMIATPPPPVAADRTAPTLSGADRTGTIAA